METVATVDRDGCCLDLSVAGNNSATELSSLSSLTSNEETNAATPAAFTRVAIRRTISRAEALERLEALRRRGLLPLAAAREKTKKMQSS
jgi:hypothetical protein